VPEESSLDTLRLSIALAQALEEARRRIGVKGEVRILDQQGKVLARLPALVPHATGARVRHVTRDLWRPVGQAVALEIDFELSSFYFDEFQRGEQTIYPVYSEMTGSLDEIKRSFFWFYLIVLGGVVMLASFGGALFAQRLTRRVAVLIGATQRVAEGDLSVSVPVRGTDEISDLAKSFNHMVSEVKESRARVLYLERIGAWKEIARRLAHEIKNPLTPIRLAVQQVRSSYKGDDARFARLVKEADEIVDEEITSLRALVEEFSEFARLPDITLVPEDLTAFAHELCEQNPRFSEGVTLSFRQGPQMIVRLDRRALRRAVVNLLKNAAEAIAEAKGKGSVIVSTSLDAKGRAVLTVEDDGPGIPEEMREKIFEPYYTSKDHGTGLGLAIVKRTVFEHQGEVELSSREGGGAVFVLSFPCVDEN
jgi:nitrogen fixation/metabolism regulation signal transduction histidine kinase